MCRTISIVSFLLASIMFSNCVSENQEVFTDCVAEKLEQNDMIPYDGEILDCEFFLTLHLYDNKQYFILDNHCVDMIIYVINCNNDTLSVTQESNFFREKETVDIIGYKPI